MRLRLFRRRGPSPSAVAAERDAQQQWDDAKRRHAEAAPIVSQAAESLDRNNYGESILALLQGHRKANP